MKILKNFVLIFLYLSLSGFQTKSKDPQTYNQRNPREINLLVNGKRFYINDSSLYSQRFIRELQSSFYGTCDSIILINDTMQYYTTTTYSGKISHNRHLFTLPNTLTIGKPVIYVADISGRKYSLTLLRTNLTEIKFDFNINGDIVKSGVVILQGTFYFGAECGSVDENGKEYCSAQYLSENYNVNHQQESAVNIKIQYGSGDHVSYSEYFANKDKRNIKIILRRQ